jgi:hypothetical protein
MSAVAMFSRQNAAAGVSEDLVRTVEVIPLPFQPIGVAETRSSVNERSDDANQEQNLSNRPISTVPDVCS